MGTYVPFLKIRLNFPTAAPRPPNTMGDDSRAPSTTATVPACPPAPATAATSVHPMIEADAYALSYPKAGRTWLRALVGKVLADSLGLSERRILETEYLTRRAGVPTIGFDHDGSAMRYNVRWQDMPRDRGRYAGKRVLLRGRDVRDNLVSAYFQATRRIDVWHGPIAPVLRDDQGPAPAAPAPVEAQPLPSSSPYALEPHG